WLERILFNCCRIASGDRLASTESSGLIMSNLPCPTVTLQPFTPLPSPILQFWRHYDQTNSLLNASHADRFPGHPIGVGGSTANLPTFRHRQREIAPLESRFGMEPARTLLRSLQINRRHIDVAQC